MDTQKSSHALTNRSLAAAIFLILFGAFFRVGRVWLGVDLVPNFAPMVAIALCGGAFLPRGAALSVPLVALFASDVLLNAFYHVSLFSGSMLLIYACYVVAWLGGFAVQTRGLIPLLGAAAGNSLLFYFVTNTAAWWGNSAYGQTFSGWVQALTVGLPGYAPTWMFFRNSLVSDLLFTTAFYVAVKVFSRREQTVPATVAVAP